MASGTEYLLPKTTIPANTVKYVPLPAGKDHGDFGIHAAWFDGTSNATIELQDTCYGDNDASYTVDETQPGNEYLWYPNTDVTITGPSGSGAGCYGTSVMNSRALRRRLKISATADTVLEITRS